MKKTKPKKSARKFATADCETNPFEHAAIITPFVWGFYCEGDFKYFFEVADFVEFIRTFEGVIYFHNGGKFDIHFLLDYVEPQENIMLINGRIARIKIGSCEIRDSYLLLPVPLSAYKKDEFDYSLLRPENRSGNFDKIYEYLRNDCVYLYEILLKQFELYGHKLTLASSAFDFWHKNFSKLQLKPKSNLEYFKNFRNFYYGGRVQCFKKGIINEKFDVFDINSAYPFAMVHEHPYSHAVVSSKLPPHKSMGNSFINFVGISNGALPLRGKNLSLEFPADGVAREYHATGWELKMAIENNLVEILKIKKVVTFQQTINFKSYVDYFFDKKAKLKNVEGAEAEYLLVKLYLNALYGKFAQSSEDHRDYELIEPQYIEAYKETMVRDIEGHLIPEWRFEALMGKYALMSRPIEPRDMKFYNVATAASITGFVRSHLYSHILKAKTPLYCDTDSVAAVKFPCRVSGQLGDWSHEGTFKRAAIGGKKLYAFEYLTPKVNKDTGERITHKISSKGVRLSAKEIFDVANGEEVLYKNIAPTFSLGKKAHYITRKVRMT